MDERRAHRLLLMLSDLGTGGAEWQTMHLARGLAARGHDVTLLALGQIRAPVHALQAAGVRVVALGATGPRARLAALPTLARFARRADLVHCVNWDASLYGRLAALAAGRPVVVADHSNDRGIHRSRRGARRGRWVALHHRVLSPLTAATVACGRSQERLLRHEGVAPGRFVCIPNGIPVADLESAARMGPTRGELGLADSALVVMHVAHFRPEKNQAQTLATVAELRRRLDRDVRAVFVGEGPEQAVVRRRAAQAGGDLALFLGRRTDVPGLLTLADLVVLPSRADTMPVSILEAMALGVPVVAYDVGDVRAMLEATGGGVWTPYLDGDAFTAACERLLRDPALRGELSRRGRAASRDFDAARMVDRYADVFDAALERRRAKPRALRVAHVGPDVHGRGGIPSVIADLLDSPLADRHRLDFIPTYGSATYGEVDRWRRVATFARGLFLLVAWSLGPGPRLAHIHTATRGSWYRKAICVVAVRSLGRPVILQVHAGAGDIAAFCEQIGPVRRRLFALAFGAADRVLSVSAAGAREIERGLGIAGIVVMPTATPRAHLRPPPDPTANGDATVNLLYLGGFANPAKGGQVLVDALPEVMTAAPQVSVALAGSGHPPAIDAPGGRVRALGWLDRDAVAAALDEADIMVLPSVSEGLPVALLEARAHGTAVVATRVGGIPEAITDGVDGVLVAPRDPAALAQAITQLASDPARRARLARAARESAAEHGGEDTYERLDGLYRELARCA